MSNQSNPNSMVSVPRETVAQASELLQEYNKCGIARELRQILAQPAEQHQGERDALLREIADEWGAGGPGSRQLWDRINTALSAHSVPSEVERLRNELGEAKGEYDKLAELDALLAPVAGWTAETRSAVLEAFQEELNESASYDWYDAAIADLMRLVEAVAASAEPGPALVRPEKVSAVALREVMDSLAVKAAAACLPSFYLPAAKYQAPVVILGGVCVRVSYSGLKWYHDQLIDDRWEPLAVDEFDALLTEALAK